MALKRPSWPSGRVITLEHTSKVLADNPLGDPFARTLEVWLPPLYDALKGRDLGKRFPVLFDLAGFTSSGRAHTAWRNFDENVPERAARLLYERKMAPAIIVFPDCFTAFGGNQYVNSSAVGRYADYLTRELVPFIDGELRTLAAREHRGVFGKSSGGYGALLHAMKYPKCWGAAASHSGDAGFETLYAPEWPATLDELASYREPPLAAGERDVRAAVHAIGYDGADDGRIMRFLARMWTKRQPSVAEIHALTNLGPARDGLGETGAGVADPVGVHVRRDDERPAEALPHEELLHRGRAVGQVDAGQQAPDGPCRRDERQDDVLDHVHAVQVPLREVVHRPVGREEHGGEAEEEQAALGRRSG